MYRFLGRSVLIAALVTFTGVAAFAQKDKDGSMTCRENNYYNDRLVSNCEIREQTLSPSGAIAIDGRQNGGISVKGWDQGQIWCGRACKPAPRQPPKPKRWGNRYGLKPVARRFMRPDPKANGIITGT